MQGAEIARVLAEQDGVISRRQIVPALGADSDIARMVRRKELTAVLPGTYVAHTGPLTWQQRAWAGVLHFWPAALTHASAVRAAGGSGWRMNRDDLPIHVAVDAARHLADRPGYVVVRTRGLDARVQWNRQPPRTRFEDAILDIAVDAVDRLGVIAVLADACQSRRTTAARLLDCLALRSRIPARSWIRAVLEDVATGACSVLEHEYLTGVERPHGLPRGQRQVRELVAGRPMFRDVKYARLGVVVELDGRLFHDTATQRDRDLERDLDVAVGGGDSIRLGWGQVVARPCDTAGKLGRILRLHGWKGQVDRCGPNCPVRADRG